MARSVTRKTAYIKKDIKCELRVISFKKYISHVSHVLMLRAAGGKLFFSPMLRGSAAVETRVEISSISRITTPSLSSMQKYAPASPSFTKTVSTTVFSDWGNTHAYVAFGRKVFWGWGKSIWESSSGWVRMTCVKWKDLWISENTALTRCVNEAEWQIFIKKRTQRCNGFQMMHVWRFYNSALIMKVKHVKCCFLVNRKIIVQCHRIACK